MEFNQTTAIKMSVTLIYPESKITNKITTQKIQHTKLILYEVRGLFDWCGLLCIWYETQFSSSFTIFLFQFFFSHSVWNGSDSEQYAMRENNECLSTQLWCRTIYGKSVLKYTIKY